MRMIPWFLLAGLGAGTAGAVDFRDLKEETMVRGFRTVAVYLDDSDRAFGARFQHKKSGFVLDLLRIPSVPQAFTWVNSAPDSDRGEPHTQEHLLLLKGNMGRGLAASEPMSLTRSSAYTMQEQTCYFFSTTAGTEVFYKQFEHQLDALLHPDYTDEEIRREVRNFGVAVIPQTGKLRLEEKGAVYNEMVSSANGAGRILYKALEAAVYGTTHPLSYDAGGDPPAIREMRPEHIRAFHRGHYFLANMGSVMSLPEEEKLDTALAAMDTLLNRVQPKADEREALTEAGYPAPKPSGASVQVLEFPSQNEQQPGMMGLAWKANRRLSVREMLLLDLFCEAFAGDSSTNLYKLLVDGKTRKSDLGPQSVYAYASNAQGFPLRIGAALIPAANITEARVTEFRKLVMGELERVRSFADGSEELREFNARVRSRVVAQRRGLAKLVNSPPGFGARNTSSAWMTHLRELNREPGFEKKVTQKDHLANIEKMLESDRNVWRERITTWKLLDEEPFAVGVRPRAALLAAQARERQERIAAETARLEKQYGVTDAQQAIRRYQQEYDARTAELEQLAAKAAAGGRFLENPPMTLDDQLQYRAKKLRDAVPLVTSSFASMTGATAGLALRLDGVEDRDLVFLSLLPSLLTQVGVIENGQPVPYERMSERLRNEILSLHASFTNHVAAGRVELLLRGSGNDLAESRRAVEWMRLVLLHPDWRPENLARLRDVVSQSLASLRNTTQMREEAWVRDPAAAYRWQANRPFLATSSFLTRAWMADRMRWMLADCGSAEDRKAVAERVAALGQAAESKGRAELKALVAAPTVDGLSPSAARAVKDVAADLAQLLPDLPDGSLRKDWAEICASIRRDILLTPEVALERLTRLRVSLLSAGKARMWLAGSAASQERLEPLLDGLAGALRTEAPAAVRQAAGRPVDERLREHDAGAREPRFVGLLVPSLPGGVFITQMPGPGYFDTDRESLLRVLAGKLFSGGGTHTVFTKTVGAGLAYSNGVMVNLRGGLAGYYAERMPEIPQTLHFAIDVVKKGPRTPAMAEYAIAQVFQDSFAGDSYEERAQAMADALADGLTPERVAAFRQAVLGLRKDPELPSQIFARVDSVYGRVLPGYGPKAKENPGAVYFAFGNEKQLAALEGDTWAREDEHVYRLYPRDFWLMGAE